MTRLFYEEFGQGKPIICLHGYPLDYSIWLPLVEGLQSRARLILPDLRGHGRSPAPAGVYTMEALAGDVLGLMDDLKIEKVVLAGHSMGGYVALAFAREHAERLAGLALVSSHCFADAPEKAQARLATATKVEKEGSTAFLADSMLPNLTADTTLQEKIKELIVHANPAGVAGVLRGMAQRVASCQVLEGLRVPAVIIAGEKDVLISLETARDMAARMQKPWLKVLAGTGHLPMLEAPEQVMLILRKLVSQAEY